MAEMDSELSDRRIALVGYSLLGGLGGYLLGDSVERPYKWTGLGALLGAGLGIVTQYRTVNRTTKRVMSDGTEVVTTQGRVSQKGWVGAVVAGALTWKLALPVAVMATVAAIAAHR